jgi:hypothetical protein
VSRIPTPLRRRPATDAAAAGQRPASASDELARSYIWVVNQAVGADRLDDAADLAALYVQEAAPVG